MTRPFLLSLSFAASLAAGAQTKPEETEFYEPVPKVVNTGKSVLTPVPADAKILFDGKNLDQWVSTKDPSNPAQWTVHDGVFTVKKGTGNIQTKEVFTDYQLHLEWQ
ncbi:family 16 glycoside hydrolase, partial [Cnuella takakiae]